jgi:hypothetical protein
VVLLLVLLLALSLALYSLQQRLPLFQLAQ